MLLSPYLCRLGRASWVKLSLLISCFTLFASIPFQGQAASVPFADRAFQAVWERTDAPVALGKAERSWYWGPQPGTSRQEPYSAGQGGTRLVQYFDKARMEINNISSDRNSPWFVTTGLLVAEMVSGKRQVGDHDYTRLPPAEIALGGDGLSTDPDAPTYTSFRGVASIGAPGSNRAVRVVGQLVTATISRSGRLGSNQALGLYPGAMLGAYSDAFGHNIPSAMWEFLNLKGLISSGGKLIDGQSIADWVYVMGYPISEPYWARVKIGGVYNDVLFQLYERRTLAYIPSFTKDWQVQMGNVGQHYYRWLYGGPLPSPLVPLASPTFAMPSVPASIDASISPQVSDAGSPLFASLTGFKYGEDIVSWFTGPDGSAADARINLKAAEDGKVANVAVPTIGLSPGLWAITFHGKGSGHESIAYFDLLPAGQIPRTLTPTYGPTVTAPIYSRTPTRTHTPLPTSFPHVGSPTPSLTVPVVPTEPPAGLLLRVQPGYGPPGGPFTFSAQGLGASENVQVKFTAPGGSILYPAGSNNGAYVADADGRLIISLVPSTAFPSTPLGAWLFEVQGRQSHLEGVIGFTLR